VDSLDIILEPIVLEKTQLSLDEEIARHPELLHSQTTLFESKKRSIAKELKGEATEILDDIDSAFEAIGIHIESLPPAEREKIFEEFTKALPIISNLEIDSLLEIDLQKVLNISNHTLNFIYGLGYQKLQDQEYVTARAIGFLLIILNPQLIDCWILFGFSLLELKRYEKAQEAFDVAMTLDPKNPRGPYFSMINAIDQKNSDQALQAYEKGIQLSKEHPDSEKWEKAFVKLKSSI
jgi:tetratricopeptide (TPR) repeat protein